MNNYILGVFKQVIYESDNGYIVGLFRVKDTDIDGMQEYKNKAITFTGYFHELNEEESYYFFGEEVFNQKYGLQFSVSSYEKVKPVDKEGIVEFLSSDLFKGIGEKLAFGIVESLGENVLETILEDKNSLMLVPRMTEKKANVIYNTLVRYEESHSIIVFLTDLGFSMREALNIYNIYKSNTMTVVESNIYRVIEDVDFITFPKIDSIVHKKALSVDSAYRFCACIIHFMEELTFKNGDTYLYFDDISEVVYRYLGIDIDTNVYLEELASSGKIYISGDKYYLAEIYEAQYNIASKFNRLLGCEKNICKGITKEISVLAKKESIIYNSKQEDAIKKSLENNITIITGGPGTGKTTIIKAIVEVYKSLNKYDRIQLENNVALLAPTGRASKRISESTGMLASTIHRFLKWNKESNSFSVNEFNPDYSKLIIIDEVSMIDIPLMDNLLKGLTDNIQLVLVGDYNQLPSVGPGEILKELIESNLIDVIELDLLYRQDENSYIPSLAVEIKNNELTDFLSSKDDYTFLSCSSNNIIPNLEKFCVQAIDKNYDKSMQVMVPMYAGINGIDNLNKRLQNIFNPPSPLKNEIKHGDVIYRESDKVLQLVNMPDDNVFNGDIGVIKSIKKNEIIVEFEEQEVTYSLKELVNIKHGFVISIHKSQGSEFDLVVIPIDKNYKRMMYRKLIYTAVTRAKKKLVLIGEPDTFEYSAANTGGYKRKSDMADFFN